MVAPAPKDQHQGISTITANALHHICRPSACFLERSHAVQLSKLELLLLRPTSLSGCCVRSPEVPKVPEVK